MILADSSVLIDFLNRVETEEVRRLERFLEQDEGICTCGMILTEVLQGFRKQSHFQEAKETLKTLFYLPMGYETYVHAAEIYRSLRRRGIIIRKSVDCLIASVAIEYDVPLLHRDRDFDPMERHCGLIVVNP